MPFTCAIDMERRLVIVTASDRFTLTDLRVECSEDPSLVEKSIASQTSLRLFVTDHG
jgi:hypothetical protein